MSKKLWNQCDDCGRLIAYDDFTNGRARHQLLEPDSDLGGEKWETLCAKHWADEVRLRAAQQHSEGQTRG